MIMKPFSLKEYLKDSSKKYRVVTRDGRDVKIICTDAKGIFPVIGLVMDNPGSENSSESPYSFRENGKYNQCERFESSLDLFFGPIQHEGWINIFKSSNDIAFLGQSLIYESKEDAERGGKGCDSYAATIKIEWEE